MVIKLHKPPKKAKPPQAVTAETKPALTGKAAALAALVEKVIADDPFEYSGLTWAMRPQQWFADELGWSLSTLKRVASKAPFTCDATKLSGEPKSWLIRIGAPGDKTYKHFANIMMGVLEETLEKHRDSWVSELEYLQSSLENTDPNEKAVKEARIKKLQRFLAPKTSKQINKIRRYNFGLCLGLAEAWPAGIQVAIFKTVMKDWPGFAALVGAEVERRTALGEKGFYKRFYEVPTLKVVRRFPELAIELFTMKVQANEMDPPPELAALDPALWPKQQAA